MITYVLESSKDPSFPATPIRHGRGIRSLARDLAHFCFTHEAIALRTYGKHLCVTLQSLPGFSAPEEKPPDSVPFPK